MLNKPVVRRPVAILLVVLGALAMFLAPETWAGVTLLALGVALESIGIALHHRDSPRPQGAQAAGHPARRSAGHKPEQ